MSEKYCYLNDSYDSAMTASALEQSEADHGPARLASAVGWHSEESFDLFLFIYIFQL